MKLSIVLKLFVYSLFLTSSVTNALDMPQPKAGLWELHTQQSTDGKAGDQVGTMRQCMYVATMAQSNRINEDYNKKNCSKNEIRKEGNKWIWSLVCRVGTRTMSGQETREFNGDDACHGESISTYDPPLAGRRRKQVAVDGNSSDHVREAVSRKFIFTSIYPKRNQS